MRADLAVLLPKTKLDTEKASALVAIGFPAVEPVIPDILEWLQDPNWPVARVLQPFLAAIGRPLAPHVRSVLGGADDCWKYSLLTTVVLPSKNLARALRPDLERLVSQPSTGEAREGVDQAAREALSSIDREDGGLTIRSRGRAEKRRAP